MTAPITVRILVSVPDSARFDACTLCFDTLRVGFPTAKIRVEVNRNTSFEDFERVAEKARAADCFISWSRSQQIDPRHAIHHAQWIRDCLYDFEYPGPLVICDPDTIFWKSCEDWDITSSVLWAGYYVPKMWNDFAKCVSFSRIHTSMMVFPNPSELIRAIKEMYPYSAEKHGEYCPCDPFMPAVRFINTKPFFWDTCSNLYQLLPRGQIHHFNVFELEAFDHLNSASFYDVMMERMDDNRGFSLVHNEWVKRPELLRNLWPIIDRYYRSKKVEGEIHENLLA